MDTLAADNIICPYCGWVDEDSYEMEAECDVFECGDCERKFDVSRSVSVTYTTYMLQEDCEHKFAKRYKDYFMCNDCNKTEKMTEDLEKILIENSEG